MLPFRFKRKMRIASGNEDGFSLIELLVVIAIIVLMGGLVATIVLSILLPILQLETLAGA